jgi:hypothetical protein
MKIQKICECRNLAGDCDQIHIIFKDSETGGEIGYIIDGSIFINIEGLSLWLTLEQWLTVTRLTNALWFSNLINEITELCYNPSCFNRPNGAHRKQEGCVPFGRYLKERYQQNINQMSELRISQGRPAPPNAITGNKSFEAEIS